MFQVKECEISFRLVEGDEEKEQLEKANKARSLAMSGANKRKFGGGRRGGRGNKRRRF